MWYGHAVLFFYLTADAISWYYQASPNIKMEKFSEELICPLCMDLFTGNVRITKCGHNYCEGCLTAMISADEDTWNYDGTWPCPECRTEQTEAPAELTRNYALERSVVNYKTSTENICAAHDLKKKLCEYFNLSTTERSQKRQSLVQSRRYKSGRSKSE